MNNYTAEISYDWRHQRKNPLLLLLVSVILITWLPTTTHAKKNSDFDHFSTGFPLSGQHIEVACEACHVKGVFKGTPKLCAGCHNGRTSPGKPSTHFVTTEACDDCHTTFGWERAAMDHTSVIGDCKSCHAPYPRGHVPTISPCDDCHITLTWESVHFDHANITTLCRVCHSPQMPNNHPPISGGADCGACHNTHTWAGARYDHSTISSPCSSCHADDQPNNHPPTTEECGTCHTTQGWEGAVL